MSRVDPKSVMSADAVQRLQQLLLQHAVPHGGMNLEMLDGLLSGVLVGPVDIPPAEYRPLVWGSDPGWRSPEQQREADRLVEQLAQFIAARIHIDPDKDGGGFMPLVSMPAGLPDDPAEFERVAGEIDFPLGAAWAGGFLYAVDLRLPQWRAWEKDVAGLEESIGFLLRLIRIEPQGDPPPPSFRERVDMLAAMPYMLRILDFRRRGEQQRRAAGRAH